LPAWHRRVTKAEAGLRLDRFLTGGLETRTRSQIKRWIEEGRVHVDGTPVKAGHRLRAGETVSVRVPPPPAIRPEPEDIPLRVVYEDDALAVIDKPAGLSVHPGAGRRGGTLVNALLGRGIALSGIGAPIARGSCTGWTRGRAGSWWWPRRTPRTGSWRAPSPRGSWDAATWLWCGGGPKRKPGV